MRPMQRLAVVAFMFTTPAGADAYVDLAPTLGRILRESEIITVAEVTAFNSEKASVLLKKVRDLKGSSAEEGQKHQLLRTGEQAVDRALLDWAEPGSRCVLFITGKAAVVCVGEAWYQATATGNGWWRIAAPRPDLPLAYYGSVGRLIEAIPLILEGKHATITTLPHGANREGASFDLALNRASLPGLVKVQRVRASKRMPDMAMGVGSSSAYVIGNGRSGIDELQSVRSKLKAGDAAVRAEAALDLGTLLALEKSPGPTKHAQAAAEALRALKELDDKEPLVQLAAASAILRSNAADEPWNKTACAVLALGLRSSEASTRRHAARLAGLAGAAAAPLTADLAALLSDEDVRVRRSALQAIATLGTAAAKACDPVAKLLDEPQTAVDAADALGRMGPAARAALPRLARLLASEAPAERWAAVRAMAQIGGPDAAPAVKFIARELPRASEADGYNMLIYLSLLGPQAKEALPAIKASRVKNPFLRQATAWAIEPGGDFPAAGPLGDAEFVQYIMEAYVRELGPHLQPAATGLAKKIMTGNAGEVPPWGYKLLARFPKDTLAIFAPGLADKDRTQRERAAVAIGYMGAAAAAARSHVETALQAMPDEREQNLLQWCLREIGPK